MGLAVRPSRPVDPVAEQDHDGPGTSDGSVDVRVARVSRNGWSCVHPESAGFSVDAANLRRKGRGSTHLRYAVCIHPPGRRLGPCIRRRRNPSSGNALKRPPGGSRRAGLDAPVDHFRRPAERPFTAGERGHVTILFGGLTPVTKRSSRPVFQACGHLPNRCRSPDLGRVPGRRQFGNNGSATPPTSTVGNLVKYLQRLEAGGLSRQEILDRYVSSPPAAAGPAATACRGRVPAGAAQCGFDGFRVLLFGQTDGINAKTGEPGFELSLHLGLSALNGFTLADTIRDFGYGVRPFETTPGATNRASTRRWPRPRGRSAHGSR